MSGSPKENVMRLVASDDVAEVAAIRPVPSYSVAEAIRMNRDRCTYGISAELAIAEFGRPFP